MIRVRYFLLVVCALGALATWATGGQSPALPAPTLPGIPGIPRLDLPQGDGSSPPRAIGAVDPSRMEDRAELLSVEKIWDQAPHNAFTDLIWYRGRWYCAFREGSKHVSADGAVRVITSADGVDWATAYRIASEYADVRDPKFSITSDRRLMLSAMAAYNPPTKVGHQTLAWYSLDGRNWGVPFKIGDPDVWLWRVTWHRRNAYSMAYSTLPERFLRMYVGPGGLRFRIVSDRLLQTGFPSEATLLFNDDDTALCLLRRDGGNKHAYLGYSKPPYRGWEWRDLGLRLGGPNMIRLPDGRLVAAGRGYDPEPYTTLLWIDEQDATAQEILALPSGGDNSYPGLVFRDGVLWVSYYSSHEGKASIYLAKVRLPEKKEVKVNEIPKLY